MLAAVVAAVPAAAVVVADQGQAGLTDDPDDPSEAPGAQAVIAHIDTGINPYHEVFRDDSAQAERPPSTYIEGYPDHATALNLTLNASTWEEAFEQDREIW